MSSEEDLDGAGGSEDDLDHQTGGKNKKAPRKVSKKETDLVVVNDEGSIVLGDTDDEGMFSCFRFHSLREFFFIRNCCCPMPQLFLDDCYPWPRRLRRC